MGLIFADSPIIQSKAGTAIKKLYYNLLFNSFLLSIPYGEIDEMKIKLTFLFHYGIRISTFALQPFFPFKDSGERKPNYNI